MEQARQNNVTPEDVNVRDGSVRDQDGVISGALVEEVRGLLASEGRDKLVSLAGDLHQADLADVLEALRAEERAALVQSLGAAFDLSALIEVDEGIRDSILEILSPASVAQAVIELDSDDAVQLIQDLDEHDQSAILAHIPEADRLTLRRSLDFPEDSAGRRMQAEVIAVPPFWTVGHTIDYMRESEDLPDDFYEIFIIDPTFRPIGTVSLNILLRTRRPAGMDSIMAPDFYTISADSDQEEVARLFERYDLVSAAVTDNTGRLVGVITVDDIVDVIEAEADEDIRRLGGVGDEEISDTVVSTAKSRFGWLLINLATAVLASGVISLFDTTIDQMVALAILMPIVASMGGNAGTQTMTVAVRALATGDIAHFNVARVIGREALVGFINGCLFALVMGVIAWVWFQNVALGVVIGVAMIINMLAAGLFGIIIPLVLNRLNIDPAIASGTFVTTVTDVVGFFAFLGFAAYWFQLG